MKITQLSISDVLLIEPELFIDERGFFFESFNQAKFEQAISQKVTFSQDNHSKSFKGVLRGLHYQDPKPQGKLIRVSHGEVFDVAVDMRDSSPTYGKWVANYLSAENKKQHWIPEGFAHGFLVVSEAAEVLYKTTDYYEPEFEKCIAWDDPDLNISWPITGFPIMSHKDERGLSFKMLKNNFKLNTL